MLSDGNKMWATHVILNLLVGETNNNNVSYLIQYILNSTILRCNQCEIINDILHAFFFCTKILSAQ